MTFQTQGSADSPGTARVPLLVRPWYFSIAGVAGIVVASFFLEGVDPWNRPIVWCMALPLVAAEYGAMAALGRWGASRVLVLTLFLGLAYLVVLIAATTVGAHFSNTSLKKLWSTSDALNVVIVMCVAALIDLAKAAKLNDVMGSRLKNKG